MGVLTTILGYLIPILSALPNLITGVEKLWSHTPKSGVQKWISVEQAISGTIQQAAEAVAKAAPNKDAGTVSDSVAVFTKQVNDAFVKLMNELGILPAGTAAATTTATTPTA